MMLDKEHKDQISAENIYKYFLSKFDKVRLKRKLE